MTQYCLGIESTAHTLGMGVVAYENGSKTIVANERSMYQTSSGGLIPAKLSEHHLKVWPELLKKTLQQANISTEDISLISYSRSPGIGHALRIGFGIARSLSLRHNIPLIGVNHCVSHLEIGRYFAEHKDPVLLYASGANTQVIALEQGRYRVFGETVDIGVGNFLDTVARSMNLGFPGGPKIEELAAQTNNDELIELPYAVKGMDVSFSGLQTAIRTMLDQEKHSHELIAYSIQEVAFAMLLEISERALAHTKKECLVLGGGVACNQRLQEMCRLMCAERGVSFHTPKKEFLVDNGAMIALLGITVHDETGATPPRNASIDPYQRVDEVSTTHQ